MRSPSITVRRAAAHAGEALAQAPCDIYGLAEDLGLSKPTIARAIRYLRACGFEIRSESQNIEGGHAPWMFTGLYSMPRASARRWRKMQQQTIEEVKAKAGPEALMPVLAGLEATQ